MNSIVQDRIAQNEKSRRLNANGDPLSDIPPNDTYYQKIMNNVSGTIAEIISANYWLSSYFNSYKNDTNNHKKQYVVHVADEIQKTNTINKKLYTATTVLMIASILNYFVDQTEHELKIGLPPKSTLGSNLHWWLTLLPNKIDQIDRIWQYIVQAIPLDGFVKFFFLFAAGFCIFFFSFFIRIHPKYSTATDPFLKNYSDYYGASYLTGTTFDVVNFPDIYNDSIGPVNFGALVSFFFAFMIFLLLPFIFSFFNLRAVASMFFLEGIFGSIKEVYKNGLNSNSNSLWNILSVSVFVLIIFSFFIALFSGISTTGGNSKINGVTNNLLMSIIGFLFALFGTPVVVMIVEMITRMFNVPLSRTIKYKWESPKGDTFLDLIQSIVKNFIHKTHFKDADGVLKTDWSEIFYDVINVFIVFTFLGLWFGIMGGGIANNWLANGGNGKEIKFIMIFIISMIFGWFLAFSPYFKIISSLINIAIVPVKGVLFLLAPVTILALSITQLVLADKASKVSGKVTDG